MRSTLALVLFLIPSASQSAEVLTFPTFKDKVLTHYPRLKAAHSDLQSALARQMQAQAGFWPSVSLSAGYQLSDDPVDVFGMKLRQERFTSSDFDLNRLNTPGATQDFAAGVHVQVPLFDALRTISRTRASREEVKAAGARQDFERAEALLLVQDAYLNAVLINKLHERANQLLASAQADLSHADALKAKGLVPGPDYYAARLQLGTIERICHDLERQERAMAMLLNILMGETPEREWTLAGEIHPVDEASLDIRQLLAEGVAKRQDLAALEAKARALEQKLRGEKGSALPTLNAFGDATNDRDTISSSGGNNYAVGIKAELPLFDRTRRGRIDAAQSELDRTLHEISAFKDNLMQDIAREGSQYLMLREDVPLARSMRENAAQGAGFTSGLYDAGRRSIMDVMQARLAQLQAELDYDRTLAGMMLSRGRMMFLSGTLDEAALTRWAGEAGL